MADEIEVETFENAREAGGFVVDVREPDEYEEGHVPGAVNIPLGELADRTGELPDGRPIYTVCASGRRSLQAVQVLRERGIDAVSLAGGTTGWTQSGRPVTKGSAAT